MLQLRRRLGALRQLDTPQRLVYLRLQLRRLLGRRRDRLADAGKRPLRVTFVCHGNIMRSPTAEGLLRERVRDSSVAVEVNSAGVFAVPGRGADRRAVEVAERMGVTLAEHRAAQLSQEMVSTADIICVMDSMNEAVCVSRHPEAEGKIVLLGAFGRNAGEPLEIDDPYMGNRETVAACFARIQRSVEALYGALTTLDGNQRG